MSNELATTTDEELAALAGAADNIRTNDFVGVQLKFKKGKWTKIPSKGVEVEIGDTAAFAVDMLSYACGWVKWENKKPVQRHIYRPIDGWRLPSREQMPNADKNSWPLQSATGTRTDPWQENHQIVLKDLSEEQAPTGDNDGFAERRVTWTTTSYYGKKAIKHL